MTKILDDDDNDILRDGETRTFKMYAKDGSPLPGFTPMQRAIAAATHDGATFDASLHRPGHRYANDAAPLNDAQCLRYGVFDAAKEKAYSDSDRDLSEAWRGNTGATGRTGGMPLNDSREQAYRDYQRDIENAWRRK
jgi:hypothetical protein